MSAIHIYFPFPDQNFSMNYDLVDHIHKFMHHFEEYNHFIYWVRCINIGSIFVWILPTANMWVVIFLICGMNSNQWYSIELIFHYDPVTQNTSMEISSMLHVQYSYLPSSNESGNSSTAPIIIPDVS